MLDDFNADWQELKRARPGERFAQYHERYQERDAPYLKAFSFFATVFCVGMSVVLPISSESTLPALVFAMISAVLLPGESRSVAKLYDTIETLIRGRARARRPVETVEARDAPPQVVHEPGAAEPQVTRARVVPPRIAGTLKIWSSADQTAQPSDAPKVTIVFFPPPAEPFVEANQPPDRRGE